MSRSVLLLGGGGHAKVLIDALHSAGVQPMGIIEPHVERVGAEVLGVRVLGDEDLVLRYTPDTLLLVNALGSIRSTGLRQQVFERFKKLGYGFAQVVHPTAIISPEAILSEGAQVMAGAVIQAGARIGANVLVNTRTAVDHDCLIGDHVHLAPGVTLSGGVEVGEGAHIGTGATVIQGVKIGNQSLVGAGAVVVRDVPPGVSVLGVPAKEVRQ